MPAKLIVALDGLSMVEALGLAYHLREHVQGVKLGDLLLETGVGIIPKFKDAGLLVMTDNKWCDIPHTVANKVRREANAGADLITVSMMNQPESLAAARTAAPNAKLVGVTVLTSKPLGNVIGSGTAEIFTNMGQLAAGCRLDGITVPYPLLSYTDYPLRAYDKPLKDKLFRLMPGVRMLANEVKGDDQQNSPPTAPDCEYVVVGRPIVRATSPQIAAAAYRKWLG